MNPEQIATLLVKNANDGIYLFTDQNEFLQSVPKDMQNALQQFFMDGSLSPALRDLGWKVEPYNFLDDKGDVVNFSNTAARSLADHRGGTPKGFRLTLL